MYKKLLAISLFSVLTLGAGCQGSSSITQSLGQKGNCAHPYYPLKKGNKIVYETKSFDVRQTFSIEVEDVTANNAKVKYHFEPDFDILSDIDCSNTGISSKSSVNPGAFMNGATIETKTLSANGDIIPANFHIGSEWSSDSVIESTNSSPDAVRLGFSKTVVTQHTDNKAINEESVTTPAGTFNAIKVESKMKMSIKMGSDPKEIMNETTSYNYFVRDKGLVKSETKDGSGNTYGMNAITIIP